MKGRMAMLQSSARQRLAKFGFVMGVALVAGAVLPATTVGGVGLPQTITCTTLTGRVNFLPGLTSTLPAGTLERVNFHLDFSGCTVTGGAPATSSGHGADIDGSSRRYPLVRTGPQTSKGLCGVGWNGETAWNIAWKNSQHEKTQVIFQTLTIGPDANGNLSWSFGPSTSRASGAFMGFDLGGSSMVKISTGQPATSPPVRCFQKVTVKYLNLAAGSVHIG